MDAYTGKYYLQSAQEQEATILFLKDKLSIGIRDEYGNPRVIYWPYEQIIRDNFWKRGQAIVRTSTYPIQTIEVDSKEFADQLENVFNNRERSWISRAWNKNVMGMVRVLVVFVVLLVAAYIWLVPFLAERLAKKVPVSYEEKLGNGMYEAMKPGFNIDAGRTAHMNDFFRELNIATDYNVRITVVQENSTNAFAMPGGNIVVYDKILAGMSHYQDLAALLSHEFTHIDKKHTTRSLFRKLGSSLFLSIVLGDVGTIGNVLVNNADELKTLDYSRKLEKEADLNGLKLLSDRKIDCNGFVQLFTLLTNEIDQTGGQPSEWMSSHPDLERRIRYVKENTLFNKNGVEENETLKTLFLKIKSGS